MVGLLILALASTVINEKYELTPCPELIQPENPLELIWPGAPAGGLSNDGQVRHYFRIKFVVQNDGKTSDIRVLESDSRIFLRAARRTIANTTFNQPDKPCEKIVELVYERNF